MTNAVTDNSISTQNVVLWQYDKAEKFCAVVDLIETWGKKCTQALWDYFVESVHGLFLLNGTQQELAVKIDDFSLSLWGIFVGISRPTLTVGNTTATLSKVNYRKVLAARLKLLQTNGSLRDISQYCEDIFGTGNVVVSEGIEAKIGSTVSDETASVTVTASAISSADVVASQYGKMLDGNADFIYSTADGGWKIGIAGTEVIPSSRLADYGLSFVLATGRTQPANGDKLAVTYSVTGIKGVRVNSATCLTGLAGGTSQTLTYTGGSWSPSLATYGVTVRGTAQSGDTIILTYNPSMEISYSSPNGALTGELQALFNKREYWEFYPAGVRDHGDPDTRFISFRGQYNAELAVAGAGATAEDTTTKPNFFSGVSNIGTEQSPTWVDWKGVFHPKERKWSFYDETMKLITTALETTFDSTATSESATATVTSTPTEETATVARTSGTETATASVVEGSTGITDVSVTSAALFGDLVSLSAGTYTLEYKSSGSTTYSWYIGSSKLDSNDLSTYGIGVTGTAIVGDKISVVYSVSASPISETTVNAGDFGTYVQGIGGMYVIRYDGTGFRINGKRTYFEAIEYSGTATNGTAVAVAYVPGTGLARAEAVATVFGQKTNKVGGTYVFTYSTSAGWKLNNVSVNLSEYGIILIGTPNNGDNVTVVYTAQSGITGVTVNREIYETAISGAVGTKVFTKTAEGWTSNGTAVTLSTYGITVIGIPVTGNTITVVSGGSYSMSYANGVWTLTFGSGASAKTATQTGNPTSVWADYGIYFMKGSGMSGTFPTTDINALWS